MFIFLLIINYHLMTSTYTLELVSEINRTEYKTTLRNLVEEFSCEEESNCNMEHTFCSDDEKTKCSCYKAYIYNNDTKKQCDYKQKKQLTAFLLELFVGFGAGHFYRGKYLVASLKLVAFIFGIYIICLFPLTAKCVSDCCDSDCLVILVSIFFYLCACGLAFWFIFDLVNFGKNNYNDKNGYKLYSWKKPK